MMKRHHNIEFTADFPTVWFVQMMWEILIWSQLVSLIVTGSDVLLFS